MTVMLFWDPTAEAKHRVEPDTLGQSIPAVLENFRKHKRTTVFSRYHPGRTIVVKPRNVCFIEADSYHAAMRLAMQISALFDPEHFSLSNIEHSHPEALI